MKEGMALLLCRVHVHLYGRVYYSTITSTHSKRPEVAAK